MSGHSKWATTRRAKAVVDAKRAANFTKVAHIITLAAREKGGDPDKNFSLRLAVEKARAVNMPKENIERAIKRGTGDLEGEILEEITYEGFGPGGVAFIIQTLTNNRNRSVSEIKHLLSKNGGNLGSANSVLWMFERRGMFGISRAACTDDLELALIEQGVQDIIKDDDSVTVTTTPEDFQKIKEFLDSEKIELAFAEIELVPKERSDVDDTTREKIEHLIDVLEGHDDVTAVSTNLA